FQTVAEPLDGRHAMVVILSAPEIKRILEEEAEWAHLQVFVYDTERHPLFIGGELPAIQAAVSETLVRSQAGAPSGPVPLKPRQAWHGVATYHPAPSLDGVFIIVEQVSWVYWPFLMFLTSLVCLVWLAGMPWKAAESLRRAREASDLKQFALRV